MEPHENWVRQPAVMNLMQLMLTYPEADHSSAVQGLLCGSFRLGHLIGLYRASRLLNKNKELWRNATTNNSGIAFHIWLYHFMGGARRSCVQQMQPSCSAPTACAPMRCARMRPTLLDCGRC